MTLGRLIEQMQYIYEHSDEPQDIEVAVGEWDDNAYDGDKIEGVRLVRNIDMEENKAESVLFIVRGCGRQENDNPR